MPILNKDMQVCISIAARPSNIGTRFHNYLYDELGLNFIYKGFAVDDEVGAVQGIRALKIRGAAVSMPHKESVIPLMDEMDPSASAIDAVNTIVNTNGHLKGYNTDYQAVIDALKNHAVSPDSTVALRGSGGMAKAVVAALRDSGYKSVTIFSRNEKTGSGLAEKYGFNWAPDSNLDFSGNFQLLINVTPIGMFGGNEGELSFPKKMIEATQVVFEVIAMPAETPLVELARTLGKVVISGTEIMASQAALQFELYTGVKLDQDQIQRASEFSTLQ